MDMKTIFSCTHNDTSGIPDSTGICLGIGLDGTSLDILVGCLAFVFLQLGPAVLQKFDGKVLAIQGYNADVPGHAVVGRQGVR